MKNLYSSFINGLYTSKPFKIVTIYLVLSLLWIFFSDMFVYTFYDSVNMRIEVSIIKGFVYVIITVIILFGLVQKALADVTALNKQLSETNKKYNLISENTGDVIWIINLESQRVNYASPSIEKVLGYSPEEIIYKDLEDIIVKEFYSPFLDTISEQIAAYESGDASAKTSTYEFNQLRRNGSTVETEVSCTLIKNDAGKVTDIVGITRDISKRKKAEELLKKSEEKFNAALYTSPNSININRLKDGLYVSVNNGFAKLTGYTEKDVIGKTSFEINIWADIENRKKLVRELKEKGKVENLEARFRTKDGHIIDGIMSASLIQINGEPHILSITYDVTEKKLFEERIRQREKDYRSLYENMLNGFMYCKMLFENNQPKDLIFLEVNPAFEKITGLKNVVGKSIDQVIPGLIGSNPKLLEIYNRLTLTGTSEQFEYYFAHLKKWFSVSVYSLQKENFIAVFENITERKEAEEALRISEERYRLISTVSSDYMFSSKLDANNNPCLYWVVGAFEKITEYTIEEYNAHGGWRASLYPDDLIKDDEDMKVLGSNRPLTTEIRTITKSGKIIWVNVYAHPVWDEEKNKLIGVYGAVQNISDRKQAEQEIINSKNDYQKLAAHLQTAREDERANIAREMHDELGQILSSIKMNLVLIQRKIANQDNADNQKILSEIVSLNSTIDAAVMRVRKLITQLRPELLDKLGLIAALEWHIQEFQKETQIRCDFFTELEEYNLDNQSKLTIFRIVQESLTNAAKYSGADLISVQLYKNGEKVFVEIQDNGKGIRNKEIEGKNSFGLFGMRERASLVGGELFIVGNPGEGTLVKLIL